MATDNNQHSSGLNLIHWIVLGLSLGLTILAWRISASQIEEKLQSRFDNESKKVVELVLERLQKYEDALWAGVATIYAHPEGMLKHKEWRTFSKSLRVDKKYPGINGIGVIFKVPKKDQASFEQNQRRTRPGFKAHPPHANDPLWPITYIEPEATNLKAIGLDMAHETNRYQAALKAEATGLAQVTGPIVLVQDSQKTPGFLFYAPFYKNKLHDADPNESSPREAVGLVYAPFIMKKLMDGTLRENSRDVFISITDNDEILYSDELINSSIDRYETTKTVDVYGRKWKFEIHSKKSLHQSAGATKPYWILFGGIVIDCLLLFIFIAMGRVNRKAYKYAEEMTREADRQREAAMGSAKLASLGEMAGGVAHEINNPIAIIHGSVKAVKRRLKKKGIEDEDILSFCDKIEDTSKRMATIVKSMKALSRNSEKDPFVSTPVKDIISDALGVTEQKFKANEVQLEVDDFDKNLALPCRRSEIGQVLINLLSNAFDAVMESETKKIKILVAEENNNIKICVADTGPGIPEDIKSKILEPFYTTKGVGQGTGLGLSISRKIILNHKGSLDIKDLDGMTSFCILLPKEQTT